MDTFNQQRLQRQHDNLYDKWNLLTDVLQRLERSRILATMPEEQIRLEHQIKEKIAERDQVELELRNIEFQLGLLEIPDAPATDAQPREQRAATPQRWIVLTVGAMLLIVMGMVWRTSWKSNDKKDGIATPIATATLPPTPAPTATPDNAPKAGEVWKDPMSGMEFVYIPGGCFQMGQTETEKQQLIKEGGQENYDESYTDELPRHKVCVHKEDGFWMGKYEVTNAQYRKFKPDHDSGAYEGHSLNDAVQPVVNVSWDDARAFVEWLTAQHGGKYAFRLPSEAEWEYAARANTETVRYWGDDPQHTQACTYANVYDSTSKKQMFQGFIWTEHPCDDSFAVTAPVGRFAPNSFRLYDMLGNVWEWCADAYASYQKTPTDGSFYGSLDDNNAKRLLRGGSWLNYPSSVRGALRGYRIPANHTLAIPYYVSIVSRGGKDPTYRSYAYGMRVVCVR